MANILQVTTPEMRVDYSGGNSAQSQSAQAASQNIQNPVDPSRVTRADGRDESGAGAARQGFAGIMDYSSNYAAFVKNLASLDMASLFFSGLFKGGLRLWEAEGQGELSRLAQMLLSQSQAETPQELAALLRQAAEGNTLFSGPAFDWLRGLAEGGDSPETAERIGRFLKAYNDSASGDHLLRQMRLLTQDIGRLLQRPYRADFKALADQMDWEAPNGDTAYNTQVLNGKLFPYLSSYISASHDYGQVREAVMLLIYYAVQYENGKQEQLEELLGQMSRRAETADPEVKSDLETLLVRMREQEGGREEGGLLAELLSKGARGLAGQDQIDTCFTALKSLLVNESVYFPLLHVVIPFQYQGRQGGAEGWLDPGQEGEKKKGTRMFFKFSIESLGDFELLLHCLEGQADVQLRLPAALSQPSRPVEGAVKEILERNGFRCGRLLVETLKAPMRLSEAFPEIIRKGEGINVRV